MIIPDGSDNMIQSNDDTGIVVFTLDHGLIGIHNFDFIVKDDNYGQGTLST